MMSLNYYLRDRGDISYHIIYNICFITLNTFQINCTNMHLYIIFYKLNDILLQFFKLYILWTSCQFPFLFDFSFLPLWANIDDFYITRIRLNTDFVHAVITTKLFFYLSILIKLKTCKIFYVETYKYIEYILAVC